MAVTILVRDYDKAAKWYSENLGFEVRDNKDLRLGRRWVAMFSKEAPIALDFTLTSNYKHRTYSLPRAIADLDFGSTQNRLPCFASTTDPGCSSRAGSTNIGESMQKETNEEASAIFTLQS